MNKQTKQFLGFGVAAVGLFLLLKPRSKSYVLPDGRVVKESELPQYGYVNFGGYWFTPEKLNEITRQQNTKEQWAAILRSSISLTEQVIATQKMIEKFIMDNSKKFSPPVDTQGMPPTNTSDSPYSTNGGIWT
jgi:hypothetical protein